MHLGVLLSETFIKHLVQEKKGVIHMDAAEAVKMFWPVILIAVVLALAALYDLIKRENVRGSKAMWAFIIIVVGTIGPILYFALGREK